MSEKQKRYARTLVAFNLFMELYPFSTDSLDGEVWEWIDGYRGLYKVSNYSRVKSFQIGKSVILRPYLNPNGYLYVQLSKFGKSKNFRIHRLVASAFLPNPDNLPDVDHINGDRLNCCASNLRWCTRQENIHFAKERQIAANLADEILPDVLTVNNVRGYLDENNVAWLNVEDVARGLGFTTVATSGNECVRWNTVHKYLMDFGVATSCNGDYQTNCPEFIPENIFYRLAMKAKNEVAEKFQAKVCDEILPTLRKTGKYELRPKSQSETKKPADDFSVREKIKLLDKYIELAVDDNLRDELIRQAALLVRV